MPGSASQSRPHLRRASYFLALAVGWSWAFWWAVVGSGRSLADPVAVGLLVVGAAGVPGAALFLLFVADGKTARRRYLRRVIDPRRAGPRGWTLAVVTPPAVALIAAAAHGAASGGWPVFAPLRELGAAPLGLLAFAPFMLVFGPLPEELGWRGYALEPLQRGLGPLRAAMLLGVVHALWHLPLFFMEGSYQHSLGVLNISFWRFMANVLVLSIVMTWLFNRTRQSTLAMIIFHFADNLTGELFDLPEPAEWLRMGLYALIAACLVAATRGQLGYRRAIRRYKGARRDRKSWTP